jgi:hypothetical protein
MTDSSTKNLTTTASRTENTTFADSRGELSISPQHAEVMRLLADVASRDDAQFRELATRRIAAFVEELRQVAGGRIEFANTETWRAAYERILASLDGAHYRSVSWVKSDDYWNDLPGRRSMQLNFALLANGLSIERILIVGWNLWPPEARLPSRSIRQWIEDQHFGGIAVRIVRESDLINEPDLLRDFGIYGDRATGEQETDNDSRTMRFVLSFSEASVRLAQDRWDRLFLFSRPYGELLDHGLAVV